MAFHLAGVVFVGGTSVGQLSSCRPAQGCRRRGPEEEEDENEERQEAGAGRAETGSRHGEL